MLHLPSLRSIVAHSEVIIVSHDLGNRTQNARLSLSPITTDVIVFQCGDLSPEQRGFACPTS